MFKQWRVWHSFHRFWFNIPANSSHSRYVVFSLLLIWYCAWTDAIKISWCTYFFWKGEWKHIGSLPFWYDAYLPNGSTSFDAAFSKNGEDSSLINSMSEFYNNEHNINLSELNETDINSYSVMANLHSTQLSGFSYQFVSGDTNEGKFINYCIIYFHFLLLLSSC